jgi:predicted SAM-dependent methyltransferase
MVPIEQIHSDRKSVQSTESSTIPRRLNLGCGWDIRDGYLNVDLHERHNPDLIANVLDLSMLPSDWFEEIVAQDILEHVERSKVEIALREWARLLSPGGVLEVRVPSLEMLFKMLAQPNNRPAEEAAKIIHLMYGTQAYTGDYHLAGFTAAVLEKHLNDVGLLVCKARYSFTNFDVYARKTINLVNPTEFVHSVYFHELGRPADVDGINYFVQALHRGMSREEVIINLRNSREGKALREIPFYLIDYLDKLQVEGNQ